MGSNLRLFLLTFLTKREATKPGDSGDGGRENDAVDALKDSANLEASEADDGYDCFIHNFKPVRTDGRAEVVDLKYSRDRSYHRDFGLYPSP